MNLKKLFATSAILTLAVSTFAPAINSAKANYNAEINSAYSYAYEKNVTTLPTVESAFPMGKAIRSHVAKMISNWALVVLNKQPNEAITPVFTDIAGESEELQGYIKKSAQQGLMGQGITEFMPKQEVTRAQFGTALSRALFGNKYDGGSPYYVNHLENLKKLGVMNDITNAERPILRYEIWLMLQRSEKLTTKDTDDGLTPEQILGCLAADDYLACLEKAKDEVKKDDKKDDNKEVKAGDLKVSIENKSNKIVSIPGTATSILGKVKFSGSEKISLRSVTVSRVGLGENSRIKNVWFERNGMRASNKATITADNEAVIRFNNGFEVEANETLDFVVELQDSTGGEYAFRINAVDSSAKDVVIDPNTTSTFRTTEYRVAQLEVATLNNSKEKSEYRINGNNAYDMGRFTLYNDSPKKEDRVIRVQNLNFRNIKGGDLNNLKDWSLLRDGQKINAKATIDGKYLSFSLADSIKASRTAVYTVTAVPVSVELEEGDKYQLQLRNSGDVVAVEEGVEGVEYRVMPYVDNNTNSVATSTDNICNAYEKNAEIVGKLVVTPTQYGSSPVKYKGEVVVSYKDTNWKNQTKTFTSTDKNTEDEVKTDIEGQVKTFINSLQTSILPLCLADLSSKKVVIVNYIGTPLNTHWEPVTGKEVVIKGGSLFLTKDQNFPSTVTAGTGYSNVVLAKGKINIAQSVKLGELKITSKNSTNLETVIKRAWIVIGGKRYSTSKGQSTGIYSNTLVFDHDFYIGQGEHDIELVANITKNAQHNAVVEFNPIKWSSFAKNNSNYTNSEETKLDLDKDGIGQLKISDLYIQKSSIGLTKTSNAGNIEVVVGNSDTKELFAGVVTNNLGKTIYFDDLKLVLKGSVAAKYADVYVEIDGNQRSSQFPLNVNTANTTITIPSIPGSLEPGKSATIKLIGVVDGNLPVNATMDGTLQLTAIADGNRLVSTVEILSTLKITPTGTTSIIGGSAGKNEAILVNVANTDIFETLFTVRNDSQTLSSIDFVYSTWNVGSNIADVMLKSVDIMYKKSGDKESAWKKLARKGLFAITTGTYNSTTRTFVEGISGTGKNVNINIDPTAFPVGNYDIKVVGSFANYSATGVVKTGPVMKIDGVKLGFPGTTKYVNMTTNNQKLISVAYPVLSATNKVSSNNNNAFTLVVTKPNDTSVASIKVTKVVTEVFNGTRTPTATTRAQYNGNDVGPNNAPSTTSVDTPIEIQVQSAQNPVRVKAIEYEVTDADGYVTKYTADGSYGIVNVGLLKS